MLEATDPATDSLDEAWIRETMRPEARKKLARLTVLPETDSTNSHLLRLPTEDRHAHAVLADRQTVGRGRRQRAWHSPAGGNIYLSLGWRVEATPWPLSTLALVAAVAVCEALSQAGLDGHGIKWPNDILVNGRKLAGILVESQSSGSQSTLVVLGVGLNVRMPDAGEERVDDVIDQPWTDLASEMNPEVGVPDRNQLSAMLLDALLSALDRFKENGFATFNEAWRQRDLLYGKRIMVEQNGVRIIGEARGIDKDGGLLLDTGASGVQVCHSGEVSVRYG